MTNSWQQLANTTIATSQSGLILKEMENIFLKVNSITKGVCSKFIKFLPRYHSKIEFTMKADYFTDDLCNLVKNHLSDYPISSFTIDSHTEINSRGDLSIDSDKLASSKYFRCIKQGTKTLTETLSSIPPNSQNQLDIWDAVEIKRLEEIFKAMVKDKCIATKGDLNSSSFAQFYFSLRTCMIGKDGSNRRISRGIEGNVNRFTSPESTSKHAKIFSTEGSTASKQKVLNINLKKTNKVM